MIILNIEVIVVMLHDDFDNSPLTLKELINAAFIFAELIFEQNPQILVRQKLIPHELVPH